jgi:hypothetical protein
MIKTLLLSITILLNVAASCDTDSKIPWEPKVYVGDYKSSGIVNEDAEYVYSFEPRFNEFGCFDRADWKKFGVIMESARIPNRYKDIVMEELKKIDSQMNQAKKRRLR